MAERPSFRWRRLPVLLLAAASALAAPARASGVDISARADRTEITIGDRFTYTLTVAHPRGARVELPSVLGNLGSFEVKDYHVDGPHPEDGREVRIWTFVLSTFTVGEFTLPSQQVDIISPRDSLKTTYFTQPIAVTVKRTTPESIKDIADIAAPAPMEGGFPWALPALGVLALAAGALWLRRRRRPPGPDMPRPPPPFEEAMQRLSGLSPQSFIRQNQARELCFALSEILRRYVSRRYAVGALWSTTEEFLARLPGLPLPAPQREWIQQFCRDTDLVKFAGAGLLETEAVRLHENLRQFLEATRPRPDEAAPAAGAAPSPGAHRRPRTAGASEGTGAAPERTRTRKAAGAPPEGKRPPDAADAAPERTRTRKAADAPPERERPPETGSAPPPKKSAAGNRPRGGERKEEP